MAKKAKKSKKRATRKKASGKGGSSSAGLRNASAGELQAELQRRARDLAPLESKRAELLEKVALLDAEIGAINGALGASTPSSPSRAGRRPVGRPKGSVNKVRKATRTRAASGRRRPRNAASLEASLAKALRGKTMGVSEVAAAVQKDGYKTTSANFRTIVNQTLIKSSLIKKTGRGQYTAK